MKVWKVEISVSVAMCVNVRAFIGWCVPECDQTRKLERDSLRERICNCVCAFVCVCVYGWVRVYLCVLVRKREREKRREIGE